MKQECGEDVRFVSRFPRACAGRASRLACLVLLMVPACARPDSAASTILALGTPRLLSLEPGQRVVVLQATRAGLLVGRSEQSGELRLLRSSDEGATWQPAGGLGRCAAVRWHDACGRFHALLVRENSVHHITSNGTETSAPDLVLKNLRGGFWAANLLCADDRRLAVLWIDRTRGWMDLAFSQSSDHGGSWSAPVTVNWQSRGTIVRPPALLQFQNNAWFVIWAENRDAETLFDIYYSSSNDGRIWSAGVKLNDDHMPGWNVNPAVTRTGRHVLACFEDFRERDRFGEPDENIYCARVAGLAPSRNQRINDRTPGYQAWPDIDYDPDSKALLAAWQDQRERLWNDLYASFSTDEGATWSANRQINETYQPETILEGTPRPIITHHQGVFYVGWHEYQSGRARFVVRRAVPSRGSPRAVARAGNDRAAELRGPAIEVPADSLLLRSFSFDNTLDGWNPLSGSWILRRGALLGFGSGTSFIGCGGVDLSDFVIQGRFRLDPTFHHAAMIYFRVQEMNQSGPQKGYALRNTFRQGVSLWRSDSGFSDPSREKTTPINTVLFPFRQNVWYSFRLVVAGSLVDYYIDDRRICSGAGYNEYLKGRIFLGVGGGPVEFDDIRIFSIQSVKKRG